MLLLHSRSPLPLTSLLLLVSFLFPSNAQIQSHRLGRSLMTFKESKGNATFECSPAGPCVPCHYSEKNDEKYRCSETGYRIPLKCIEFKDNAKKANNKQNGRSVLEDGELFTSRRILKWRRLLDASTTPNDAKRSYVIYRSCVPAVDEEKLSVLGFEGIMVCLLLSSAPVVYFRRKRSIAMSGIAPGRIPTNSRF